MNEKYNAYVRSVADYFIEEMKKGTAPWQQDWDNVVPVSAVTDAPYRGTNALLLMAVRMSQGYGDNRWLTCTGARRESKKGRTRHQVHLLETLSGKGRKR